ncbi:TniQ family protein [Paenibacillus frigoriresistens]|uniref:TnsD family Tn7-like transposition protein n=1 Tax=Paenibacillus alginolyticus TaxID=59839 RepID=UPI0015650CC7|nr:TnsD family Tn7-like transposition protein [Paenibacillus frigoriresistens]NRF95825.1 TniQ family protein [Paenibacillus frigoriresistens]
MVKGREQMSGLPYPYPDELLYSVITRYHLRSSNSSPKWTLRDLYGTENVIPTFDLPSHIEILSNRSALLGFTAEKWIEQHTFYPYYTPFMPEDRADRLKQLMKSRDGSGIHTLVGITASTIDRNRDLLFCSSCYEDDIALHGEPYWHRIHQLPGVLICPTHRTLLHRITHPVSDRHGLTVLPISRQMFRSSPIKKELSDRIMDHLYKFTIDVQLLLQIEEIPALYQSKKILLPRLHELGYVTIAGRIRQMKLEEQFVTHYGKELLDLLECYPNGTDYTWLTLSTRSVRHAIHPIRQLLFIRFLYGSFQEFLSKSDVEFAPFGEGPWPCLNRAATHYRELIIAQCQITQCTDTGRPVGAFGCQCGFSYSRRGPDECEESKYHRGRIKMFGYIWHKKLQECIQEGLSFRASAKILGVDAKTVIKYAKGEGIDNISSASSLLTKTQIPKVKHRRERLINDGRCPRIDWEKRDLELSWLVEQECKRLLVESHSKPIRVCIRSIGNRIGKLSLLEKSKHKLPITMSILTNYLESVSKFQIRRVKWAADSMLGEWPLKQWKIIRKAGLKQGYSREVSEEIDRCIGESPLTYYNTSTEVTQLWGN